MKSDSSSSRRRSSRDSSASFGRRRSSKESVASFGGRSKKMESSSKRSRVRISRSSDQEAVSFELPPALTGHRTMANRRGSNTTLVTTNLQDSATSLDYDERIDGDFQRPVKNVDSQRNQQLKSNETSKERDHEHTGHTSDSDGSLVEETNEKSPAKCSHVLQDLNSFRQVCGNFVNDRRVQVMIIVLIVINAIMMGIATFDFVADNPAVNKAFETTDTVFLIIFTLELGLQFIYHGIYLFTDGWLLFDLIIVVLSWSFASLQVIRAFRALRAFRLVTRLQVLQNLVLAIFQVAPTLSAILFLLLLIMYIFAVLCTELFNDLYDMEVTDLNYFGSLDSSLFWLFSMMTLEWAHIVRQVRHEYHWAGLLFMSFLCLSSFILFSLIIAVVCDAVAVTEHQDEMEEAELEKQETREQIAQLEKRLHNMTLQQQALLQALQKALLQIEEQRPESPQDENTHGDIEVDRWYWSGSILQQPRTAIVDQN